MSPCQSYVIRAESSGFQVMSNRGSSGPERRKIPYQHLPGNVDVRKRCSVAGTFLQDALERSLIAKNPFKTKAVPRSNIETKHTHEIKEADAQRCWPHSRPPNGSYSLR